MSGNRTSNETTNAGRRRPAWLNLLPYVVLIGVPALAIGIWQLSVVWKLFQEGFTAELIREGIASIAAQVVFALVLYSTLFLILLYLVGRGQRKGEGEPPR